MQLLTLKYFCVHFCFICNWMIKALFCRSLASMITWGMPLFNLLVGWGKWYFPAWFLKEQYLQIILVLRAPRAVNMNLVLVCHLSRITCPAFLLYTKRITLVLDQILVVLIHCYRKSRFESCILFAYGTRSLLFFFVWNTSWGFNVWKVFIVQSKDRLNSKMGKPVKQSMGGWKSSHGGRESGRFEFWLAHSTINSFLLEVMVKNTPEVARFCEFPTWTSSCSLFLPNYNQLFIKTYHNY